MGAFVLNHIRDIDEMRRHDAEARIRLNLALIGICFMLFTFIVAINPDLLKNHILLTIQLTLAIPFMITSTLSLSKLTKPRKIELWDRLGIFTFIVGYGFMINVVGILLSTFSMNWVGMLFYGVNLVLRWAYGMLELIEHPERKIINPLKELFFTALIVFLGILPSLGVY